MNDKHYRSVRPDDCVDESDAAKRLEQFVQAQLRQLPDLQAPPTLIPRVLAAVQSQRQLGWWHQSWFGWPRLWQVLSLAVLATLPAVVFFGGQAVWKDLHPMAAPDSLSTGFNLLRAAGGVAASLSNALLLTLRSLAQPWVLACAGLITLMYLACIGLGTACVRVAVGRLPSNIKFK